METHFSGNVFAVETDTLQSGVIVVMPTLQKVKTMAKKNEATCQTSHGT